MDRYMNTRELSKYLDINEKKIYTLITERKLPATKITGKWIFLKELVDIWLESSIENRPKKIEKLNGVLLITGSNDPLLEIMVNGTGKTIHGFFPFLSIMGSLKGLSALNNNLSHICGCHLWDSEKEEYNLPFINSCLPGSRVIALNFAYREQGLIVKKNNPLKIKGVEDLCRKNITLINRQEGSGTRFLLDSHLKKLRISPSKVKGYQKKCNTHLEVGIDILKGTADVGIGIRAVANSLGLGFIPLKEERFDLLVPKDYFFFKEVQMFTEALRSSQFKKKACELGGYDTRDSGKIIYSD